MGNDLNDQGVAWEAHSAHALREGGALSESLADPASHHQGGASETLAGHAAAHEGGAATFARRTTPDRLAAHEAADVDRSQEDEAVGSAAPPLDEAVRAGALWADAAAVGAPEEHAAVDARASVDDEGAGALEAVGALLEVEAVAALHEVEAAGALQGGAPGGGEAVGAKQEVEAVGWPPRDEAAGARRPREDEGGGEGATSGLGRAAPLGLTDSDGRQ